MDKSLVKEREPYYLFATGKHLSKEWYDNMNAIERILWHDIHGHPIAKLLLSYNYAKWVR